MNRKLKTTPDLKIVLDTIIDTHLSLLKKQFKHFDYTKRTKINPNEIKDNDIMFSQ
jgi:hypothetical protein